MVVNSQGSFTSSSGNEPSSTTTAGLLGKNSKVRNNWNWKILEKVTFSVKIDPIFNLSEVCGTKHFISNTSVSTVFYKNKVFLEIREVAHFREKLKMEVEWLIIKNCVKYGQVVLVNQHTFFLEGNSPSTANKTLQESPEKWSKSFKKHVAARRALPTTIESFDEDSEVIWPLSKWHILFKNSFVNLITKSCFWNSPKLAFAWISKYFENMQGHYASKTVLFKSAKMLLKALS